MADTPNLLLPYIAASQAQKHVTHNESLRLLDGLVQLALEDRDLTAPPVSPGNGECWLVAVGATGAWAGWDGDVAMFSDGSWYRLAVRVGWLAWLKDEEIVLLRQDFGWAQLGAVDFAGGAIAELGISTSADATNRLAVSAPAVLFSHAGDNHQVKINKALAADTGTIIFQTGFSGRAEMGLAGEDNYSFKVSADGASWNTGLSIDAATGNVTLPKQLKVEDDFVVESATGVGVYTLEALENYHRLTMTNWSSIADWQCAYFQVQRGRGTKAAPAAVADGDMIFSYDIFAHDGSIFRRSGQQNFVVDGTPSVGIVPLTWNLLLRNPSGSFAEVLRASTLTRIGVALGGSEPSTTLHVGGPIRVASYTVATVPSASATGAGGMIYVSNEAGGAVMAFSDGTDWRRTTDRAVIS